MKRCFAAVAALAAATAIGLSGCGGGSGSSGVASLSGASGGGSSGGATSTTLPKGSATQLYDEWAQCLRDHGVTGLADPTVNSQGQLHLALPSGVSQDTFKAASNACESYQQAAAQAANGGKPLPKPDPTKLLNYSKCMRAHGLADFPDPGPTGLRLQVTPNSDLNPDSPSFQAAQKACQHFLPGLGKGGVLVTGSGGPGGPGGGAVAGTSGGGGGK
jgi:hypothetical protein